MKIFNASKLIHKNILTDRTINCQLAEDDPSRFLTHQSLSSTHLELGVLFGSHFKLVVLIVTLRPHRILFKSKVFG